MTSISKTMALLLLLGLATFAESVHKGGMHKGMHVMPKESAEFHRVLEEPENHPHIKHFYDWRKQADAAGHGNAKAFRGKIPEDLIHYLVQDPGAAKQDL